MSIENVKGFLDRVSSDNATKDMFISAIADNDEAQIPQILVQLGAQTGFNFTEAEIVQARDVLESQAKQEVGEELSDEQLDMVAGGAIVNDPINDGFAFGDLGSIIGDGVNKVVVQPHKEAYEWHKKALKGW